MRHINEPSVHMHRALLLSIVLAVGAAAFTPSASAQVEVERYGKEVRIRNQGKKEQRLVRGAGVADARWSVVDEAGNTYAIAGSGTSAPAYESAGATTMATGGRDSGDDDTIIVVGGYQGTSNSPTNRSGGRDSGDDDTIIVVGGYQDALQHLSDVYGATVRHDRALNADLISLPGFEDPVSTFFEIIVSDSVHGLPLLDFFRTLEVVTTGASDAEYLPAPRPGATRGFPSDPYYSRQWNVDETNLALAAIHPFTPRLSRPIRIGVIDSGINERDRSMSGLDGVESVHHVQVAPSTGYALGHGLAVTSLLADAANDGDGVVGLVGSWSGSECRNELSVFDRLPVEIYSYNVGDWGPISVEVARAIYRSIEDGVDVLNLSLRTAESPTIAAAIQAALDANIVVVAAAGNYDAQAKNKPTSFPANIEGVISVTSASRSLRLSKTAANTGYDLIAPGEEVIVGGSEDTWYYGTGTSFAAPHVVATVALMRAANPDLTPSQAREVLIATSQARVKGGVRRGEGGGFLDALAALNHVLPESERADIRRLPRSCSGGDAREFAMADVEGLSSSSLPDEVELGGNSPNPFSSSTTIRYALPEAQHVKLAVYNMLGQQVRMLVDATMDAGTHEVSLHATDLPSGMYVYRLETEDRALTRRMILTR